MRYAVALTIAALVTSPTLRAETTVAPVPHAPRARPEPAITFQTHSVARVLAESRTAAQLVGGERMLKAFDKAIKAKLGEKGFDGLDLSKPIVGYVNLTPKLEDITVVVAFPVADEEAFIDLCERWNDGERPMDICEGMWELPEVSEDCQVRMKFSEGYAYVAFGKDPEPALEKKAIVPVNKVYDPAEPGICAVKLHFDRITPEVKFAIGNVFLELKKEYMDKLEDGSPEATLMKKAFGEVEKLAFRYVALLHGADAATLRVSVDPQTADLVVDATLTPKPGTELAKEIAARKPATNRFAGLITPDTVAGFKGSAPFFAKEGRNVWNLMLKGAQLQLANGLPQGAKPVADELFKGLIRTTKAGEGDIAAALRGPDVNGHYTAVGAISFEDPAALEKEFKKFMDADGPAEWEGEFQWDAAKAGKVNIHTFKFATGAIPDELKILGGDCLAAFAFAPHGIYVAIGADSIATIKDALSAKPVESPAVEAFVNPAKLGKLAERAGDKDLTVQKMIGWDDKLISAGSLRVISGKELTVRFSLNLKILPRALLLGEFEDEDDPPKLQPQGLPAPPMVMPAGVQKT